jgi:hypothetical protein
LFERDREAFRETLKWIRGLGLAYPLGASRKWRLISGLSGYENAQTLRVLVERAGRWRRSGRGA